VVRDVEKALFWIERAAVQGNKDAIIALESMK